MEILFMDEMFFTSENNIYSWIAALIGFLAFVSIVIYKWKDKFIRYLYISGAFVILAIPLIFMAIEKHVIYVTCEYAVIEHHNTVPKGYDVYDEKGDILFIKKTLTQPEYEASGCSLEEEIINGLLE